MTAILLRLLIYVAIAGFIYFGARKIFRDWKSQFRDLDKTRHERDLKERQRPDVIDLKRNSDGVFRPPGDGNERH